MSPHSQIDISVIGLYVVLAKPEKKYESMLKNCIFCYLEVVVDLEVWA